MSLEINNEEVTDQQTTEQSNVVNEHESYHEFPTGTIHLLSDNEANNNTDTQIPIDSTQLQNISLESNQTDVTDDINNNILTRSDSTTPKQYKKLAPLLRQIICDGYNRGESPNRLAAHHSLAKSTVRSIITKYLKNGEMQASPRGEDKKSKLSSAQKKPILGWVDENPILTLQESKEKVLITFNISCSTSTINRVLSEFHYTLKRLVLSPATRNSETTLIKRFEYSQNYRAREETTPAKNFIFLDEVGFQVVSRPKRGRALRGRAPVTYTPGARSRNISVVAAVSKRGVLYHKIRNTAFNG
ncbi:hypothetical protein CDIK_3072, partial [Cucumispora dikerogammari]